MKAYRKEIFALTILISAGALYHGLDLEKASLSPETAQLPRVFEGNKKNMAHAETPMGQALQKIESGDEANAPIVAPLVERLREYVEIKRKALLSDEERLRKQEILEDPQFLRELGQNLREKFRDQEMEQALDLILEARRYQESAVADEVLAEIVRDRRVEDPMVSISERERLAGLKAEVLYQWSSVDPWAANRIPSLLPGEVSHRLWRNVVEVQARNHEESLMLQRRFASTGRHSIEAQEVR